MAVRDVGAIKQAPTARRVADFQRTQKGGANGQAKATFAGPVWAIPKFDCQIGIGDASWTGVSEFIAWVASGLADVWIKDCPV